MDRPAHGPDAARRGGAAARDADDGGGLETTCEGGDGGGHGEWEREERPALGASPLTEARRKGQAKRISDPRGRPEPRAAGPSAARASMARTEPKPAPAGGASLARTEAGPSV